MIAKHCPTLDSKHLANKKFKHLTMSHMALYSLFSCSNLSLSYLLQQSYPSLLSSLRGPCFTCSKVDFIFKVKWFFRSPWVVEVMCGLHSKVEMELKSNLTCDYKRALRSRSLPSPSLSAFRGIMRQLRWRSEWASKSRKHAHASFLIFPCNRCPFWLKGTILELQKGKLFCGTLYTF